MNTTEKTEIVLILVVMDDALVLLDFIAQIESESLNPCCNG